MDWFIDFETRSEIDLQSRGASVYARHPSTRILCMAYSRHGELPKLWKPGDPVPPDLLGSMKKGDVFHAHNASFEIEIWNHILGPRHAFGKPDISQWQCTAARAAAASLPRSLDKASQALGLNEFKDKEGHRIMLKMCKPRKPTKNNPSLWHDKPEDYEKLYAYCLQDVVVEMAIHNATPPLSKAEQAMWELDWKINDAGVPIDLDLVHTCIAAYEDYVEDLLEELGELTEGWVTTGGQTEKMLRWLQERGMNIENMQAATIRKKLAELKKKDSPAYRLLYIRQQLSKSSIRKFAAMAARTKEEKGLGRAKGSHLYCGADRTGRWAGMGIQPQNFPRGILGPSDIDPVAEAVLSGDIDSASLIWGQKPDLLSSLIRPAITAPKGHELYVSDFAGIEARVLSWVAEQKDVVKLFRQGKDLYKVLASKIFAVKEEQVTSDQRFVGKQAVLGLGYGMGWRKFIATCGNYGRDIPEDLAQHVVKLYRGENKKITGWWYKLNDKVIEAVQNPGCVFTAPNIKICHKSRWLELRLPGGRALRYFDPKIKKEDSPFGPKDGLTYMGVNSITKQWERQRTYGGKIAENIVQAIARDLLAEALKRLDAKGYKIVLHVHDEVVAEHPVGKGMMDDFEDTMRIVPDWAKGCPIDVEGFATKRYRK